MPRYENSNFKRAQNQRGINMTSKLPPQQRVWQRGSTNTDSDRTQPALYTRASMAEYRDEHIPQAYLITFRLMPLYTLSMIKANRCDN
jgi:hypothetical protein